MHSRYFRRRIIPLAFLVFLPLAVIAQTGTIGNGQIITAQLTSSSQVDTYSFTAPTPIGGTSVYCDVSIISNTAQFVPTAAFDASNNSAMGCTAGNHQVVVKSASGTGSYSVKLVIDAQPFVVQGNGGDMANGVYNAVGETSLYDIWDFNATAGDAITLSVGGGGPSIGDIFIFNPVGSFVTTSPNSAQAPTVSFTAATTGTYIVFLQSNVLQGQAFTFSLSGSTAAAAADAKSSGAYCQQCSQGGFAAGDPVNLATGYLYEDITDYKSPGQVNVLSFERFYNSAEYQFHLHPTLLGSNWRTIYDRYLTFYSSTSAVAERPDGQVISFTLSNGTWKPDSDINLQLYKDPNFSNEWDIQDAAGTIEQYSVSAPYVGLIQITYQDGYIQQMQPHGTPVRNYGVYDSYGRLMSWSLDANNHISVITAPDGTTTTFTYNGSGSTAVLATVAHNGNAAASYSYNNASLPFALTSVTDELSNTYASYVYDGMGRVTSSQQGTPGQPGAGANQIAIQYNSDGSRQLTNGLAQVETYKFTTLQNVPKLTEVDRGSLSRTQTYDANGYLASFTDWNGNKTTRTNNTNGNPTQIVEAAQSSIPRTTSIVYDTVHVNQPATITAPGVTITFTYDTAGDVLSKTLTDTTANPSPARTWTYTYQQIGGVYFLATVKGPRSGVNPTTYAYNASTGFLTSVTDPLNHATQYGGYTVSGQPTTITDPNGVVTTLTYDQRQHVTSSSVATAAGARKTTYNYDAAGNLTSIVLPDGETTTNTYDTAHRLIAVADLSSATTAYTLNALGEPTDIFKKFGSANSKWQHHYSYDPAGHMLTDTKGTNRTITYTNDNNGNHVTVVDPDNHPAAAQVFDALNRLTQITDSASGVTQYTYDAQNNITQIKTPNGATTTYAYDGFGDLLQQTSPDTGTTSFTYDADGNMTQKKDALNIVANSSYDAIDRKTSTTYPASSTENVVYTYDQTGHGFGIGRLTSMTDQAGTLSRTYDERGNLTSEVRTRGTIALTTSYSYDAASNLATITYPDGMILTQQRDNAARIYQTYLVPAAGGTAQIVTRSVGYQPMGPDSFMYYGNNISETRVYDSDYRRLGVYASGNILQQTYGLDSDGNVVSVTDGLNSANNQTLTYDNLDRLLTASGAYGSESFTYDANGNRKTAGSAAYTYTSNSNRLTAIGSQTVTNNADGNASGLSGNPALSVFYNNAGRIDHVNSGSTTALSYLYDGFGQRITETDTAQRFQQYGQDGRLLEVTDNLGHAVTDYIYLNGRPVATFQPNGGAGTLSFLITDKVEQPLLATTASQSIGWSFAPDPFGVGTVGANTIANSLRFPGQEFELIGMNHNGARNYIPGFGRYLESDPIGLAGGQNSTYAYAGNSPGRLTDPKGLYTLQIGYSGSRSLNGTAIPFSFGFAFDTRGNLSLFGAIGLAGSIGASVDSGLSIAVSDAPCVNDLAGPFVNASVHAGAGAGASADYFTGSSPDGTVTGYGFTFGEGVGASISTGSTDTFLLPIVSQ